MATIYPDGLRLTAEEQETIKAAQELDDTVKGAGWKRCMDYLDDLVAVAQDRLDSCLSSNDRVRANLHRSAQERRVVRDGLLGYVKAIRADRDDLLETIRKQVREEQDYEHFARSTRSGDADYSDILGTPDAER